MVCMYYSLEANVKEPKLSCKASWGRLCHTVLDNALPSAKRANWFDVSNGYVNNRHALVARCAAAS